jgi:hypothetical protein
VARQVVRTRAAQGRLYEGISAHTIPTILTDLDYLINDSVLRIQFPNKQQKFMLAVFVFPSLSLTLKILTEFIVMQLE